MKFVSKINIPSVNQQNGKVDFNKNQMLKQWNPKGNVNSMEHILIALKNEMIANKKASQPADGDVYAWVKRWSLTIQ